MTEIDGFTIPDRCALCLEVREVVGRYASLKYNQAIGYGETAHLVKQIDALDPALYSAPGEPHLSEAAQSYLDNLAEDQRTMAEHCHDILQSYLAAMTADCCGIPYEQGAFELSLRECRSARIAGA